MELSGAPGLALDGRGVDVSSMARMPTGDVDLYETLGTGPSFTVKRSVITGAGAVTESVPTYVPRSPAYGLDGSLVYFNDAASAGNDCRIYRRDPAGLESVLAGADCLFGSGPNRDGDLAVGPDGSVYNGDQYGVLRFPPGVGLRFATRARRRDATSGSTAGMAARRWMRASTTPVR